MDWTHCSVASVLLQKITPAQGDSSHIWNILVSLTSELIETVE